MVLIGSRYRVRADDPAPWAPFSDAGGYLGPAEGGIRDWVASRFRTDDPAPRVLLGDAGGYLGPAEGGIRDWTVSRRALDQRYGRGEFFESIPDPRMDPTTPLGPSMATQNPRVTGTSPIPPTDLDASAQRVASTAGFGVSGNPFGVDDAYSGYRPSRGASIDLAGGSPATSADDIWKGVGRSLDWLQAVPWDLGGGAFARSANAVAGKLGAGTVAGRLVSGAGGLGGKLIPVVGWASLAAQPVMSAFSGADQAGSGGAALRGGGSAAGAIAGGLVGAAGGPLGILTGATIGGFLGDKLGEGATGLAQRAVDDMNSGGALAPVGRIASGLGVESSDEKSFREERAALYRAQMSPAMQAIQREEKRREREARSRAMENLYLQALLQ